MKHYIHEHPMELLLAGLILVFAAAALLTLVLLKYSDTTEEVQLLDKAFVGFFGLASSGMGGLTMKITAGAKGGAAQAPAEPKG